MRIFIKITLVFPVLVLVFAAAVKAAGNSAGPQPTEMKPSIVNIEKAGERFELFRNGTPYFIKGAGGSAYPDKLADAGGNSIRTWSSSPDVLDKAHEKGLTVCMGLRMQKPRHGADYRDANILREQRSRIRDDVQQLKNHPALLMWGIGNEVEHLANPNDQVLVWNEIETLAKIIKDIDPNHPVITVIAGAGPKLKDIKRLCPSLDAIGINSYGELSYVPSMIQEYAWEKPYIITEFGPRGWWEAPKTAWGLPIEQTSTEKADFYATAYKAAIDNRANCLGSYVFLWGNKQEKTHTWFNLFLPDGSPTEIVDTMTNLWTGQWPQNRAPKIGDKKIYVEDDDKLHIHKPSSRVAFNVQTTDPDGDELTIRWDIRKDASDNPSTGGDWEPKIPLIEGAVVSSEAKSATIKMPQEAGNYRIFVYVCDPSGKVATANLPIRVE